MDKYFIAIPTNELVTSRIRVLQREFAECFESKRQLKIPVHITLIPPFQADLEFIDRLEIILKETAGELNKFQIEIDGFGHFRDKVIYVKVIPSLDLTVLQSILMDRMIERLAFKNSYDHQEFTPHITLANRDLSETNFQLAWKKYGSDQFRDQFRCEKFYLYKHNGREWLVEQQFSFSEN